MDYSLRDIARICGGEFYGDDNRTDTVITDSRHSFGPRERPLFVAIRGINHDGHDFISDLYRRGVRAFMVEKDTDAMAYPGAGFVRVEKSLNALQALASDYRGSFKGLMVGITGSAGKTTLKEWMARLVPEGRKIFRSPRSYNSQLGVPLSVLMMRGDEDICFIEAGISRPGEMEKLARIIRPDVGIFTGLGPEHAENFISDEHKVQEKIKLFETCGTVIHDGTPLIAGALSVSGRPYALIDASSYPDNEIPADNTYVKNVKLLSAFYDTLGIPPEAILPELGNISAATTRLEVREGLAGSVIISDTDNTDVNSLGLALDYLNSVAGERAKMLILSDIMFSRLPAGELYGKVAAMVQASGIDVFIGVGNSLNEHEGLFGFPGRRYFFRAVNELLAWLNQSRITGMAVLVKGNIRDDFQRVTHAVERRTHTTVLEINLDSMIHNLNYFRSGLRRSTKIMAMVKASGYGNGDFEVANMLANQGVDYLAVAFADEGVRLREQGISMPIVVLNADSDSFGLMIAHRLEPEIYSMSSLRSFIDAVRGNSAQNYPVHIKVDSGMHRLGFEEKDIPELISLFTEEEQTLKVGSVFSHLAASDVPVEDGFTLSQIERFDRMSNLIIKGLGYAPLRHIANSAGTERFHDAVYDMVRIGIGLYGISSVNPAALKSVSRLVTRIVQVKELQPGETVGYGRAGVLTRKTTLATIPVGYADGFDRRLGEGNWSVEVAGKACPTVGRVSMDSCVIDITGTDGAEGGEVVVFGGPGRFGIVEMARVLGTIPYEIMTSVSGRVKRIYIKE